MTSKTNTTAQMVYSGKTNGGTKTAANSVFIKLWLDVKHSTINHYFAFVVN